MPRYEIYKKVDLTPIDLYLLDIDYKKEDNFLLEIKREGLYVYLPKGKTVDRVMIAEYYSEYALPIDDEIGYDVFNKLMEEEFDV